MRNRQTKLIKKTITTFAALCVLLVSSALANNKSDTTAYISHDSGRAAPTAAQFKSALTQVLRKVSGNPSVDSVTSLADIYQRPKKIVQAFTHQQAIGPSGKTENILEIIFNARAIYAALQTAKQNIWPPSDRPKVLLIINSKNDKNYITVSSDTDSDLKNNLTWQAKILGLPILLPMLDLDDTQTIQYPLTSKSIAKLSSRYAVKNILSVQADDKTIYWTAWLEGNKTSWRATTNNNWIKQGLNHFMGIFSENYATANSGSQAQAITIKIYNINSISDLAKATGCIKKLPRIDNMQINTSDMNSVSVSANAINVDSLLTKLKNNNDAECKFEFIKFYYTASAGDTENYADSDSDYNIPNTIDLNWQAGSN